MIEYLLSFVALLYMVGFDFLTLFCCFTEHDGVGFDFLVRYSCSFGWSNLKSFPNLDNLDILDVVILV